MSDEANNMCKVGIKAVVSANTGQNQSVLMGYYRSPIIIVVDV